MDGSNSAPLTLQIGVPLFVGLVLFFIGAWWRRKRTRPTRIKLTIQQDSPRPCYIIDIDVRKLFVATMITYTNTGAVDTQICGTTGTGHLSYPDGKPIGNLHIIERFNVGNTPIGTSNRKFGHAPDIEPLRRGNQSIQVESYRAETRQVCWVSDSLDPLPDGQSVLVLSVSCKDILGRIVEDTCDIHHLEF